MVQFPMLALSYYLFLLIKTKTENIISEKPNIGKPAFQISLGHDIAGWHFLLASFQFQELYIDGPHRNCWLSSCDTLPSSVTAKSETSNISDSLQRNKSRNVETQLSSSLVSSFPTIVRKHRNISIISCEWMWSLCHSIPSSTHTPGRAKRLWANECKRVYALNKLKFLEESDMQRNSHRRCSHAD